MEGSGYAAQTDHAAGNSAHSTTPGAAFLLLAVRQRQGELRTCASDYISSATTTPTAQETATIDGCDIRRALTFD